MASIATLSVQLTAKTSKFRRKMQQSRKSVTAFASSIGVGAKRMAQFGAATAAVAAGGMALLLKRSAEINDAIGKTADKLGIGTEKLAAFQLAGKLTGLETKVFNKSLQFMIKSIAEAARGTGEAKNVLEELGLEIKSLSRLSPDKQFLKIADAMKKVKNTGDKVFFAERLFGGRGVGLLNTLALGSKGMAEMQRHADLLGLSLSRIETKRIEQMNDSITLAKEAFSGAATQVLVRLAPALKVVSDRFVEIAENAGGMRVKVGSAFDSMQRSTDKAIKRVAFLEGAYLRLERTILQIAAIDLAELLTANKLLEFGRAISFFGPSTKPISTAFLEKLSEVPHKLLIENENKIRRLKQGTEKKLLESKREAFSKAAGLVQLAFGANFGKRAEQGLGITGDGDTSTTSALTDPLGDQARKAARIGEFKQAKLAFVALNRGETQIVDVNQKQLSVLEQIEANTANPVATFA